MDDGRQSLISDAGQWLETIEGETPILLIAPHGGHAGPAARKKLNPKVNDLETAQITRELAERLGADALINAGMDRNELDCNRVSQVMGGAPWMLDMIARSLKRIVARHGHATVLLIHGWNVIQPRVDLGLGLRERNGMLHPPTGARVSASDEFIAGPVNELARRMRANGIIPSYGLRYPGGGAQNLLQIFTDRHQSSHLDVLRTLASMAAGGMIDALQLELSVALRLPGQLRDCSIEAVAESFAHDRAARISPPPSIGIVRTAESHPKAKPAAAAKAAVAPPPRFGIEFYDPVARIGGSANFDLSRNPSGGRIMLLFDDNRVALFTAEGAVGRSDGELTLGPLQFRMKHNSGRLDFRGPAVLVNDGRTYLSVERALATSVLDESMEVAAAFRLDSVTVAQDGSSVDAWTRAPFNRDGYSTDAASTVDSPARFGRAHGTISIDGLRRDFDAFARVGVSFSGLGPGVFESRRMLWASFATDGVGGMAIEARDVLASPVRFQEARLINGGKSFECALSEIDLETAIPTMAPKRIAATLTSASGRRIRVVGKPLTFMSLSRPGPGKSRIYTSLGFAFYELDGVAGAGMFEYSRRTDHVTGSTEAASD